MITIEQLRRFTVARNLPNPSTLKRALQRLQFVQADPIRSPARAQDLILRHRVKHYRAGDLERKYAALDIEEDVFINYGYVTRSFGRLMHPREEASVNERERAHLILDFIRDRGEVHPKEVDEHFSHGKVTNYWGGSSNATTHLMDEMHYRGLLKVVRRQKGIRIYAEQQHGENISDDRERQRRIDVLVDVVVNLYAPLTASSLSYYVRRLRYAVPQWSDQLGAALQRAKQRLAHDKAAGHDWYWAPNEKLMLTPATDAVRLLAPFDPLVHDRARFELLWDWQYRFEAYTPVAKRKFGYYAMPLLWRDRVIGWANLSLNDGKLNCDIGYIGGVPRGREFKRELDAELERFQLFLGVGAE